MEPKTRIDLYQMALTDPIAAVGFLLGYRPIPFMASMSGAFSTLAVPSGTPVQATLRPNAISQRTWIDNIQYDLQVPNCFPNQVFKPQFDAYLKQSPGISVKLEVQGGPKYFLSPDFTPLECVSNLIGASRWPAGWQLEKYDTLLGLFQLTQAPGGCPSNQGPYNFTLTFNGWQFNDCRIDDMDRCCAEKLLREAGLLCTKPICWP